MSENVYGWFRMSQAGVAHAVRSGARGAACGRYSDDWAEAPAGAKHCGRCTSIKGPTR